MGMVWIIKRLDNWRHNAPYLEVDNYSAIFLARHQWYKKVFFLVCWVIYFPV
jgi:hypothetical protein